MHCVIFVGTLKRAAEISKVFNEELPITNDCKIVHGGLCYDYVNHDIRIEIRQADPIKCVGLRLKYYVVDDNCTYGFWKFINFNMNRTGEEKELRNVYELINKVKELVLNTSG